ncbi:MAG: NAD(P)/FAD-dependent oxidoreductase [Lachnospiraceae bacterium]
MSKVVIIGGGPAGMIAGIAAARCGHEVHLFEKNEKLGKKLFITGKGRCNLTNACDMQELMKQVMSNPRFLYSAFHLFDNEMTMNFFEEIGLPLKIERGNRVFPRSDHSSDVIKVLQKELERLGVQLYLNTEVTEVKELNGAFRSIVFGRKGQEMEADACIIATGGLSYPSTGSTGDGYRFAKTLGHTITPLQPSLVAVEIKEEFVKQLQGLSLKNVGIRLVQQGKLLYADFGEMLFTHFGVSGPLILSASSYIASELQKGNPLPELQIDLKPALSEEQVDARVIKDFEEAKNKQYKNSLEHLLPQRMIDVIVERSGIPSDKKVNEISREERRRMVGVLKCLTLHVSGLRDYKEAVITKGGVSVREVQPATMESRLVQGVYFAGEVLDLDAMTGGYNLQIAWSTGYAAGNSQY